MNRFLTMATKIEELDLLSKKSFKEVIISHKDLSRFYRGEEFSTLAFKAKELGIRVILLWDVLATEDEMAHKIKIFEGIPKDLYDVVRVQEVGVLNYLLESSDTKIQFIAETGNHNLVGLKTWEGLIGNRLDRMVLSIELDKDKLTHYKSNLNCPLELQVLGPILLFYSPRKLLSPLDPEVRENEQMRALGNSEESPHKNFPLLENRHGSFMFHIKDLFLLDRWDELEKTGIDFFRLDFHPGDLIKVINDFSWSNWSSLNGNKLKELYSKDVIRGYFQINKSDVLFSKLKNSRLQRKDEDYLGEVAEIVKSDYMAILVKAKKRLKLGDELKAITPEGKEIFFKVCDLKNSSYQNIEEFIDGHLVLLNYKKGVWPKSQIYQVYQVRPYFP